MELKNPLTGQTYKNAIKQYKENRKNTEQLFKFKERSIVNFALDTDVVYMTTKLNGEKRYSYPLIRAKVMEGGNPEAKGKLKPHYMWRKY